MSKISEMAYRMNAEAVNARATIAKAEALTEITGKISDLTNAQFSWTGSVSNLIQAYPDYAWEIFEDMFPSEMVYEIRQMAIKGLKIDAIKLFRHYYKTGLGDAKFMIDKLFARYQ